MNYRNIEIFINKKYNDVIIGDNLGKTSKYLSFYENEKNEELKYLFAYFHYEFNNLFRFLNTKASSNGYYNAQESRDLIDLIENAEQIIGALKNYKYSYKLDDRYSKIIELCKTFLQKSNGSPIPNDFKKIDIIEIEPIFELASTIKIERNNYNYRAQKKIIGEGSYAKVFKYKDEFYNKFFAIKQANSDLDSKELERFKLEYVSMKKLNSPYIVEVYNFNEEENFYLMEFMDITLDDYISKNNTKLTISERKNIVNQIFKAFEYINNKLGYHGDISIKNILLKEYDNLIVVKVSDFGLVKLKDSTLTSLNTEFKGSLNDPKLDIVGGFKNYEIYHETYALTRLIYFVMTGKKIIQNRFDNDNFKNFIENGISDNINLRYKSVKEMKVSFGKINFE